MISDNIYTNKKFLMKTMKDKKSLFYAKKRILRERRKNITFFLNCA